MAKFVTVHNKCSKNPTVDLRELGNPSAKMALCLSCVELHVPLCWQQRPKSERAIRLVYPPVFLLTSFFIQVQIEKSDGFRSGVWNSSISVTIDNWTHVVATNVFYLEITDTVTYQNIDFSPIITLCLDKCVCVLVICVLVFTVFCIVSFIYIYSYLLLV